MMGSARAMTTEAIATSRQEGGLAGRLASISGQLVQPRQAIEQTFLSMGERLLGCTKHLNEVSVAHQGMPEELESADFTAAAQLLETIRKQVGDIANVYSNEQVHVDQLAAMAAGIGSPLADLRKAVRTIRLIAVNARIVAAGISGNQADFGAFSDDMTTLGNSVQEAVVAFAGAYEGFASSLEQARGANAAFIARHDGTMDQISRRLSDHLDVASGQRSQARARAGDHSQLAGRIRARVGMAVAALQTGDIVRQRVEHVEQALDLLSDFEREAGDPIARAHTVSAICHLQGAQLDETLNEFDGQIDDLAASLRQLAGDTAAVVKAGDREAGILLSHGGDALNGLIDDLGEIRVLFADFGQTRASMEKTACAVVGSVAAMMEHLDAIAEIEHQISLLSLNTTIHCSRLGDDGRALRVIAQNLRELAGQTVAAAGAIMDGLRQSEGLARKLTEGRSADLAHEIVSLENASATAAGLFQAVVGRLQERVTTMGAAGPRAVRHLELAADAVSNRRDFVENWRDAKLQILSLAPFGPEAVDPAQTDRKLTAQLRAHYTMDSERRLHDAMLGAVCEPAAASLPASTPSAALDDIFFERPLVKDVFPSRNEPE